MVTDDIKKISIAFYKLFLDDFLNFMAFFVFLIAPSAALWFAPSFFCKWKVLRWYIYHVSFIYIWILVPEFSNFNFFRTSKKYHFRLLLGSFWGLTPPNRVIWNLWPMMQCKLMHSICNGFYCIYRKWSKLNQKTWFFLAHFEWFLVYTLLHPMIYASSFSQKDLMKLHNHDKFHKYSNCGWEIINFQRF